MMGLATEDEGPQPEIPEAYVLLRRMRMMNIEGFWSGGLSNQPYLLMLELQACINAENEYRALKAAILARQAHHGSERSQ